MIIKKIYQGWMIFSPLLMCLTLFVLVSLAQSADVPFDAFEALDAILWTIWSYCAITLAVVIAMTVQVAKELRMERKIKGDKSNEEEHHAR